MKKNCVHLACEFSGRHFVQRLFSVIEKVHGAAKLETLMSANDNSSETPMLLASKANSVDVTELLVDKFGVDHADKGCQALHAAAKGGAIDVAKMLLKVESQVQ